MKQAPPSPGAIRAATRIVKEEFGLPWSVESIARTIDRETALPDLLEACQRMVEAIEAKRADPMEIVVARYFARGAIGYATQEEC